MKRCDKIPRIAETTSFLTSEINLDKKTCRNIVLWKEHSSLCVLARETFRVSDPR